MARTYRDVAIQQMLQTVQEAMSQVVDRWENLPSPMQKAIEQFRTQIEVELYFVEFVRKALDRESS